ncbi:MAG: flagellar hook protein FlgE [Actinomycetota bacterium]|nr:flagellar hook protein FlgE [Actinomycetota bacterium]
MTQQSILSAVSGIQSNQTYLDSIANNIANVNTNGYKSESVQFQDLLAQQLTGASAPTATAGGVDPIAIGSGVQIGTTQLNLNEGSLETTGQATDVAIDGNGYLVVNNNGQQLYTRDGALTQDANGNLVTASGGLVQGWMANGSGTVNNSAPIGNIKIPTGESIGATPSTTFTLGGNLPAWSGSATATPPTVTTTLNGYDALGDAIPVTLTFTGVPGHTNTYTVQGSIPNQSGSGPNPTPLWSSPQQIAFTSSGQLDPTNSSPQLNLNPDGSYSLASIPVTTLTGAGYNFPTDVPGTTTPLTWSFNLPAPNSAGAVTQYASSSSLQLQGTDGHTSGTLSGFSIAKDGTITGSFSNGTTLALGQIALADFANPGGLADQGGGLYSSSPNSGQPLIGVPGAGARGQLLGGQLEQSNVDLGTELTNLINAQEAYTANTKVLTATNAVIQALEAVQ